VRTSLGNESSVQISLLETKVPRNESSTYGTFVPRNKSSRLRKFKFLFLTTVTPVILQNSAHYCICPFQSPDSPLPLAWVGTGLCHIMPQSQLTYTIYKVSGSSSAETYFLKRLVLLELTQQSDSSIYLCANHCLRTTVGILEFGFGCCLAP